MMVDGPGAAAFERKTLARIPDSWEDVAQLLKQRTGYEFPMLKALHHRRVVRAITAVLDESFNFDTSVIGLQIKVAIAQVFATITGSLPIEEIVHGISAHFDVHQQTLQTARTYGRELDPIAGAKQLYTDDCQNQALMIVAHASSFSHTRIDVDVVSLCRDAKLPSSAMIEVVTWVSVLQMLHRLSMFFRGDTPVHVAG